MPISQFLPVSKTFEAFLLSPSEPVNFGIHASDEFLLALRSAAARRRASIVFAKSWQVQCRPIGLSLSCNVLKFEYDFIHLPGTMYYQTSQGPIKNSCPVLNSQLVKVLEHQQYWRYRLSTSYWMVCQHLWFLLELACNAVVCSILNNTSFCLSRCSKMLNYESVVLLRRVRERSNCRPHFSSSST